MSGWSRVRKRTVDKAIVRHGEGSALCRSLDIPRSAPDVPPAAWPRLASPPHVVEAALNHRSGAIKGVAAVYNRYAYEPEKREALDLWAKHIEEIAR